MEVSGSKDKVVVKEVENKYQTCVSNYEDRTFELDASFGERASEENTGRSKVTDLVNIGQSECNSLVEDKYQDTTESSSSFDDLIGVENGDAPSDGEVTSDFREDDSVNGRGETFRMRKKKLTSHWRTYIQPLMWRCKWIELQTKKLDMQARNYAKELTKYNHEESFLKDRSTADLCIREVPFCGGSRRHQVLKRKKRKRIEETIDLTTYMSQHNVFSYHENKKAPVNGIRLNDAWRHLGKGDRNAEFGLDEKSLWLESNEIDESLEVVRKIDILMGQVNNLKTRLDKVTRVNAGEFPYAANPSLLVPCNAVISSGPDSGSSPNNGDRVAVGSSYIASQLMSQYHMGDGVLPESAVSSHGEVTHLSDIIGSTNKLGGSGHIEDEILIYSNRMRDGMNNYEEVMMQPPAAIKVEQGNSIPLNSSMFTDDPPPKKLRSISELTAPMTRKTPGRRRRRRS